MAHAAGSLGKALVVLLFLAWQILAHASVSGGDTDAVRYVLLGLPAAFLAYWILRRARRKALWLAVLAAATVATFVLEQKSRLGVVAATGVPHAAAYVLLLFMFGHTLFSGRDALITRVARRVHGALPPSIEAYTRRVTIAWCVFCAAQLAVSGLLFAYAPLDTWSAFVNLLNVPLLALMFAGEYAYRIVRYRDFPHASIAQTVRAFARDAAGTHGGSP